MCLNPAVIATTALATHPASIASTASTANATTAARRPGRRACPLARFRRLAQATLLAAALPAAAGTLDLQVTDGAGKPLAGAAVFVESPAARAAARPATGVEIAQVNRQFSQAVTLVTVGTAVSFPNRDTVRHHLYSFSPVKTFEIKLYVGTPAAPVVFDAPGIAVIGCNIHDNMSAWVVVVETPHHGLTGADGKLSLAQIPPGSYRLRTWHPALPPGAPAADQALLVPASGTVLASVKLAGLAP